MPGSRCTVCRHFQGMKSECVSVFPGRGSECVSVSVQGVPGPGGGVAGAVSSDE